MIVSHKYRCVFIHIPKNGGTFVSNFIKSIDPLCEDFYSGSTGHQTISMIIDTYDDFSCIKDYSFFAVIRNPIEKILSSFNYYWYQYFKFTTFLKQLDFCNEQNLHMTNIPFVSIEGELNINIKLIDFDNLSKELISFFVCSSVSDADLLNVINNVNLERVNATQSRIVTSLKANHNEIIGKYPFMNKELDFWHKFREFKMNNFLFPTPKDVIKYDN